MFCIDCFEKIPAGQAHKRSVTFQIVAWCTPCFDKRPTSPTPEQTYVTAA